MTDDKLIDLRTPKYNGLSLFGLLGRVIALALLVTGIAAWIVIGFSMQGPLP